MDRQSLSYRLVTSRRGLPGRPFGWEMQNNVGIELARSTETFRAQHEAIADGEKALQALRETGT
jgi:hypothetical protein